MPSSSPSSSPPHVHTCDQCGLPFGRGGITTTYEEREFHFCCYGCSFTHSLLGDQEEGNTAGMLLMRLGFSAFLAMNIMALSWALYDQQWIALGMEPEAVPVLEKLLFVLSIPVMAFVGWPYVRNAIREIGARRLSMDSLIAFGSFAAFGFSTQQIFTGGKGVYFDTATMTLVLVTAGRYLEANAKIRTSHAIKSLMELEPDQARVIARGAEEFVPTKSVRAGESLKILPGERIPLDGVVTEGSTSVDEAILTGESAPVRKRPGDDVFAATVNHDGVLTVRVTAISGNTIHARIVRLMEEAQRTRSPIQQLVDRISGVFIPFVIAASVLTFAGWLLAENADVALLRALTVLVVACPCALGIGTPLAAAIAIGRCAEQGLLVRSTTVFERIAGVLHMVFDKTGTLTHGVLRLWEIRPTHDEQEFLRVVTALERGSEHPVGKAIVAYAKDHQVQPFQVRNVSALPGLGIKGEVNFNDRWKMVEAGSAEMFNLDQALPPSPDRDRSSTVMYARWDGAVQGSITLNDTLRRNAKEILRDLEAMNVRTHMLSGDSAAMTRSIAESLAIRHAQGNLMPEGKLEVIGQLKREGVTVVVGDGINDAPALAAADIGITLGSATDIAKESADVTILGDHLESIPWLVRFARRTLRVIRWNLVWAFGYNALGIALAAAGILEPIAAAAAMVVSSLFIIFNSRRLARHRAGRSGS